LDKPAYYTGDTVRLTLKRNERIAIVVVTPVLIMEGATLKYMGHNFYRCGYTWIPCRIGSDPLLSFEEEGSIFN
jgi:anaerobic selenocysteine-containing dehydrogenase